MYEIFCVVIILLLLRVLVTVSTGVDTCAEDVVCVVLGVSVEVNLDVLVDNEFSKLCVVDCILLLFEVIDGEKMLTELEAIRLVDGLVVDFLVWLLIVDIIRVVDEENVEDVEVEVEEVVGVIILLDEVEDNVEVLLVAVTLFVSIFTAVLI